ncbi:unnamed protein product [Brassica oleracea]|uniref:(rape) hypothetical protein n=2 Tax=Brassica napus TaxID=3708 RepID=A0A816KP67_BRANA|nr:unnamed protein product [Brassica napus]
MCSDTIIEYEQGCKCLETGVSKLTRILEEETSEKPFNREQYIEAYTTIYNMCIQEDPHNYSQRLYHKYHDIVEHYANETVLPCIQLKQDEYLLRELSRKWDHYKVFVKWLSHFFNYLERFFISYRNYPSLLEVAMKSFRDLVYLEVQVSVKDVVMALIHKEREGEQIERELLKNIVDIFVQSGMGTMERYEKDFEMFLLEDTASYYSRKASSWIQEDSCPEYMIKSEESLKKEKERVIHYLHSTTEPKLVEIVQEKLLVSVAKQLLEKEHLCALLRDDKMDDLSRIYRLFNPITKGLEPVAEAFRLHVTSEGNALIKQAQDSATTGSVEGQVLVGKIIDLHDKYMVYVTDCFKNHTLFHKALKEAFEIFCNKKVGGSSSAELLATFCDNLFKKSGKSDEAIEAEIDNVVNLLDYISDKDLFAEFYRKKLARRLLFDRKVNDEHERSMLTKLKGQHGGQFTSKMEGMVTDMELAKENQKGFEGYLKAKPGGIDLAVTVLNTGFWPSYKTSTDLNLPREMVECVDAFNSYYQSKTTKRKLSWIYSLGTCHVIGRFDHKSIELVLFTYQAVVLCLFNNTERVTYQEIIEQLNLSHEDLVRVLHSLSCSKYKILNKEPASKSISTTDVFELNTKFTDKMRRIKVPLPPADDRKKVVEDVDKDRGYAIDACIVRIMKSRKVLLHQQLVSECVEQLSRMFKPDVKMIKKRIEELISREYLERDTKNPNTFKYGFNNDAKDSPSLLLSSQKMYRATIIDFEQGCKCLEAGVSELKRILEEETSETRIDPKQYLELYTTIYNMCIQKHPHDHSQRLYNKYHDIVEHYAKKTVLPCVQQKHDEYLLRELSRRWDHYKVFVKWLSHFFNYLERFFIPQRNYPSLLEVAMKSFRNRVYLEVQVNAKDVVIALIDKEREGAQIDMELLKNVLDIFVQSGMGTIERYKEDFEMFLLEETESYYARKASRWIQECSCPEYMIKSEESLKKEKERVTHYLHSSTESKLVEIVQDILLVSVEKHLLEKEHSGCSALLRDDKTDDLSRMYRLYHPTPKGLEPVADAFRIHVTREGNALIKQAQDAATTGSLVEAQVLVGKIIDLHEKYMVYVMDCFKNHTLFHKALKEAFEVFCNKKVAGSSSAELVANFCDSLFKKSGNDKLSDEAMEATIDNVVKLLDYISDKDIFSEFYRKKLGRRLLFDHHKVNKEHETSMITKLKRQQGGQYTSKMEGMVTDMQLAKEFQKGFKGSLTAKPGGIDLAVTVLNTGFWPSYKTSTDLNLPREMVECVEAFKSYYGTKTNQRKLRWLYSHGTCHVIGSFDPKPIELVLSTYQAVVLCLFNNTERLTYQEIIEQLNLSHEDLVRVLLSLSCAKYRILNKEPASKSISTTDVFEFNSKFTSTMRRIKVSIPPPPIDERKKVVEDVDQDRRYAIDACIVRIMKSRKVLPHQQLVSQCVEQLSRMFKPDIKMIKKRIEDLITRDYLKRDAKNHHIFNYVA